MRLLVMMVAILMVLPFPGQADTPLDPGLQTLNECLANTAKGSGEEALMRNFNPAQNNPDQVAWCLFLYVSGDAATAGNNDALFETWATDADTFQVEPKWPGAGAGKAQLRRPLLPHLRQIPTDKLVPFVLPFESSQCVNVAPPCIGEEVRRNRATFDYIVSNKLYTRDGLKAFTQTISLPADSIEIKANWVPVDQLSQFLANDGAKADPKLYHVNTVMEKGKPVQYALVALHVISKMVPNWTWATFEHVNNPGRCDILGCIDKFGATPALAAPAPPSAAQNGLYPSCPKTDDLTKLFAKVKIDPAFANYCLKGSQTDFTDATGAPTRVGNSVTEAGFVETASCMGCHARSAYSFVGGQWAANDVMLYNYTPIAPFGVPDPGLFWQQPQFGASTIGSGPQVQLFHAADFVWSIPFCAIKSGPNPSSRCATK